MFVRVTEEERKLLRETVGWQEHFSAPGAAVTNRAGSISINFPQRRPKRKLSRTQPQLVKITNQVSGQIGRHTAVPIYGDRLATATTHLVAADMGVEEGEEVQIWNPPEEHGGPCLLAGDIGPALLFHTLTDGPNVLLWMGQQNYGIPVEIGSATRDGSNWRWTYGLTRQKKTADGFAGWEAGAISFPYGFNAIEKDNGATGIVSGYELDDGANNTYVTGLEPVAVGTLLRATPYYTGARVELWFEFLNIPIVVCPTPPEE